MFRGALYGLDAQVSIAGRCEEGLMVAQTAEAEWRGSLQECTGVMKLRSGAFEGRYSFGARFGSEKGTNPEELIAATRASCFAMALGSRSRAGRVCAAAHPYDSQGAIEPVEGFRITRIDRDTEAKVQGIDDVTFHQQAETAKRDCPVFRELAGRGSRAVRGSLSTEWRRG